MYIISFFLFLNFMLILLPRLMPNIITGGQLLFWVIWVNAIFIFTLLLPHQASYIFPVKSGIKIFKMFKKISGDKAEKDDEKMQAKAQATKDAQDAKIDAKTDAKIDAKQETSTDEQNTLKKKIEARKNA